MSLTRPIGISTRWNLFARRREIAEHWLKRFGKYQ
jgi:hypothetical protein